MKVEFEVTFCANNEKKERQYCLLVDIWCSVITRVRQDGLVLRYNELIKV